MHIHAGRAAGRSRFWADPGPPASVGCGPRRVSVVSRAMNLLQLMRDAIPREPVASLATWLGESEPATDTALRSGALPATLAGLVRQFGRDESTARRLMDLLQQGGHDGSLLSGISPALAGGSATDALLLRGQGLHPLLFGEQAGAVAALIAKSSGLRVASVQKLLGIAAPLALAVIARAVAGASLSAAQLASTLREQQAVLQSAAPAGLTVALGIRDFAPADLTPPRKPALWPWLLVPAITLALFFTLRWVQQSSMSAPAAPTAPLEVRPPG